MATLIETTVSRDFKREVSQLREAWKPIAKGYADLAKQHLDFAKLILELWQTAKYFDRGTKRTDHVDYMRHQLKELVQTDDPSILSRWRLIGEHADTLLPVSKYLPVHRDHLYELARAVKQDKPVSEWIDMEKIHPGISVRDIKTLNTEGRRKKSTAKATRLQSVTLNFSSDIEANEIVEILRSAFSTDRYVSIIASQSVRDECKDTLRDIYDKLKPKFIVAATPKTRQVAIKQRKISKK